MRDAAAEKIAGALREIGLAQAEVPAALVSFNLGVEAGQLAVMALVLPCVLWARRRGALSQTAVRALSAGVVAVGLVWFFLRVRHSGA